MVRLVANHERSSMRALRGRAKLQTSCLTRLDPKDLHGLLGQRSDNAIDYTATCLRRFDGEVGCVGQNDPKRSGAVSDLNFCHRTRTEIR